MYKFSKLILANVLCLTTMSSFAEDYSNSSDYYQQKMNNNTQNMAKYLLNLGAYLGFNLDKSPTEVTPKAVVTLLDIAGTKAAQTYLLNTFLGAIPVNAFSQMLSTFVPNNIAAGAKTNIFANYAFKMQQYENPQVQGGTVSVNPLIDQKSFQQDPVSQSILNILTTPDTSYCISGDGANWLEDCRLLYQGKVTSNVIGTIPGTNTFFNYDYVKQFMSQLNSNTLTSPLMYSVENPNQNQNQNQNQNNDNPGLTAQSQAQQALNFIRYAAALVIPAKLPRQRDYDILYIRATSNDNSVSKIEKEKAQNALTNYLTKLRVYAAQTSVGVSNLFYIMSKRLPQNQGTDNPNPMSQALSEYMMATRRLYNPADMTSSKQWIDSLDAASPATVQKEIAVLLAEINYQLYLNRQQEERMLLTNSMLLLQNTIVSQPQPDLVPAQ